MQQDSDWTTVRATSDPLQLYALIKKVVQGQTDDQYVYATVYDQLLGLFGFRQENLTNAQWYEKFNSRVDVATACGVEFGHQVLYDYQMNIDHPATPPTTWNQLTDAQKTEVKSKSRERLLAYIMLRQSGKKHNDLKYDLQNEFTTGDDKYPDTRQKVLHLLDHYSSRPTQRTVQSEGQSFAQNTQGGSNNRQGGGNSGDYDKEFWKNKICFKCGKKGHPASSHKKDDEDNQDDDDAKSTASSVKQLSKDVKKMSKKMDTMHAQISSVQEELDVSDLEEESGSQHVQFASFQRELQFMQVTRAQFEPKIQRLFKQSAKDRPRGLNLREVLLIDSQSTIDLFCNRALVSKVWKASSAMRLTSNGGDMRIGYKCGINGYHKNPWFEERAIANIVSLANVCDQYRVTFDSDKSQTFVVHRESAGKPNMYFRKHESGLFYWDPREQDEDYMFVSTVAEKMSKYTRKQIKQAEVAKALYGKVSYPSLRDFKWAVKANMIKNCPVTTQDIDTMWDVWGPDLHALKGKTVRQKSTVVKRDIIKVPREFMKLHSQVELQVDIFFVNGIPFFISLSKKIYYTAVSHLPDRKVESIMKAYKMIHVFYMQRGFRIVAVEADGEFAPLKPMIEALPGGPRVNLTARGEHVPGIK